MESRRDQAQAYFFVVGRLAAAVTHGRPNVLELPNKRFRLGTMLGILIAVVLAAIFGIIGLFKPGGNTSWRSDGTVVVVTHGGVLDCGYRLATGLALDAPRTFGLFNASLNTIAAADGQFRLVAWGDVDHLTAAADEIDPRARPSASVGKPG